LGLALIFLDQFSKDLAAKYGAVVLNPGVSFGMLGGLSPMVLTLGLVLAVVVGIFFWKQWLGFSVSAVFFWSGAVSNLLDRLWWEGVQDWLTVPGLGIKNNLADWMILLGVGLLIWQELRELYNRREST
jgi:signal peptidase II